MKKAVVEESEKEELKETEEKEEEHKFEKTREDVDIIINNAFALADKKLKEDLIGKWKSFNDYVHNKEFSSLVSYFLDSSLEVAGKEDVIISSGYDTVVDSATRKIAKLELLFNLVMGKSYNIAFVTTEEWNKLKDKYVSDIKDGKKYEYISKEDKKNNIVDEDATADLSDVVNAARDIFGKDVVEIK